MPLDYEYQKFLMKRQEELLILSMSQLNLGEDVKPQVDEDDYNTDEENDTEAQQEELLDEVIELKTNAVSKETDELVKKALCSAGIINRTRLPPAS